MKQLEDTNCTVEDCFYVPGFDIRQEQQKLLCEEQRYLNGYDDEDDGNSSIVGAPGGVCASTASNSSCGDDRIRTGYKYNSCVPGNRVGKFAKYKIKKRQLSPLKPGGKARYQVCGMEPMRVEMNDQRMKKVRMLMARNNNFQTDGELDSPDAIVDHFECLLILDQANTNNAHGKGSKYPRYLRQYVGPGKFFLCYNDITRCNQAGAHEFIEKWIRTEKINTQKINKAPACLANVKDLEFKIRKLVGDYKHGIDDYLDALDKLRSGKIELPKPEPPVDTSPSSLGLGRSTVHPALICSHILADPGSPCVAISEMQ